MKKKITASLLAGLILCTAVCSLTTQSISASANSASPYWEGADGVGVYSADTNCPLQVKSENLTFNITGFPADGVTESYTSSVRAEYEFYNPTNGDITARMLFPFGAEPDYYSEIEENSDLDSLYGVTIDGEDAEADLRYSYLYSRYEFNFGNESAYLHDTKQSVDNLSENAEVTKVTIGKTDSGFAVVNYTLTRGKTTFLTRNARYGRDDIDDEKISAYFVLELTDCDYFYIIGEIPEDLAVNECYYIDGSNKGYATKTLVTGDSTAYETANAGKLCDFLQTYNQFPDGEYSEVDWFNFCIYSIDDYLSYYWEGFSEFLYDLEITFPRYGYSGYVMRWYSYDMTVAAGETVINAVTAPTYPTINMSKNPNTYNYYYLLSPASTWDSFENLTITVNAPYYMLSSSASFTMTGSVEDGTSVYTVAFESLPSGELSFTLCEVEEPESFSTAFNRGILILSTIISIVICVVLAARVLALVIIGIVFLVKRLRKRK